MLTTDGYGTILSDETTGQAVLTTDEEEAGTAGNGRTNLIVYLAGTSRGLMYGKWEADWRKKKEIRKRGCGGNGRRLTCIIYQSEYI